MPSYEEAVAELQRRGFSIPGGVPEDLAEEETPAVMPEELAAQAAEQAEAQALNPQMFEQEPEVAVTNTPLTATDPGVSPEDLTSALYNKPNKGNKTQAPKVYDYNGVKIDVSKYPTFRSTEQSNAITNFQSKTSKVLYEIDEVEKKMAALAARKEFSDIDKMEFWGNYSRNIKKGMSTLKKPSDPERQLVVELKSLEADLATLRAHADQALRGDTNAALPHGMYQQFEEMGIHPNLEQGWDTTQKKLDDLKKRFKTFETGTRIALSTDRVIPYTDIVPMLKDATYEKYLEQHPELKRFSKEKVMKILEQQGLAE